MYTSYKKFSYFVIGIVDCNICGCTDYCDIFKLLNQNNTAVTFEILKKDFPLKRICFFS